MKNIFYAILLLILLGAGVAQAAWTENFVENYDEFGMSVAVEDALSDDVSPKAILTFIISNSEKFENKNGLKALYCAGVDRDAVREAANKLGITVEELSKALEESIAECGDKLTLSDRDLMDDQPGSKVGLSERDIAEPDPDPAQASLVEQITLPTKRSVSPLGPSGPSGPSIRSRSLKVSLSPHSAMLSSRALLSSSTVMPSLFAASRTASPTTTKHT
ncbi:MAG: hypothetical protein D3917_13780, partial [Candidatus Electrothrix sp. AX5]|nr:hypothetical protein [Candidatus Electrothrix sp. AX5]